MSQVNWDYILQLERLERDFKETFKKKVYSIINSYIK